jgi:DNA-binding MarR family transcriptional regulator
MSEATAHDGGAQADAAVDRLARDWLAILFDHIIRAAGFLQPNERGTGHRLSLSESYALFELARGGPLTQRDLGERLDLEKSTVSRLVTGLERRQLVSRRRNPENRRYSEVAVTAHGQTTVNRLAAAMLERHGRVSAAMTAAERDALTTGLAALLRAMGQTPPRQRPFPHV